MTVKWSGAKAGHRVLDVCCGSGDLAFELAQAVGPSGQVVGLDFAAEMLQDAAQRQQERRMLSRSVNQSTRRDMVYTEPARGQYAYVIYQPFDKPPGIDV